MTLFSFLYHSEAHCLSWYQLELFSSESFWYDKKIAFYWIFNLSLTTEEIYFGCICTVGYKNQSIKILFIDSANILECENNILLKKLFRYRQREGKRIRPRYKQKGQTVEVIQVVSWMSLFALKFLDTCWMVGIFGLDSDCRGNRSELFYHSGERGKKLF